MEKLVEAGLIGASWTSRPPRWPTTWSAGSFPAGRPVRGDPQGEDPLRAQPGALDMVNFGAMETVPERFRDRRLHVHNAQVTLMRTTPEENRSLRPLDRRQAQPLGRPRSSS